MMQLLDNWVAWTGLGATQMSIIMLAGLFLLMVIGLAAGQELAFVLGGAGVVIGYLAWGGPGITIAMTKVYDQMQSYSMVAIPMFVLMANFLTHSKVADGLFLSIRYLLGPLKGGLGLAVILVSTVFAATTGIVGASVVTMGMLSMPVLLKCGYKPSLACGMVCAGGSLGILIPPSIMLVSMGSYAEVSVGKIFFAAIVPGLLLSLCYMVYVFIICHIHPDYGPAMSAEELEAMPFRERVTGSLVNLIPPVILIVGVLGSIFSGWATPTEASGVGALFALILAIFYRQFNLKMLYDSLIDTAKTSAMVFIILFGASAFTGIFMSLDGNQLIANWVVNMGIGKWGAFAIMMLIVFILGMFIDWLGIVMIVFPIFLPIMDMFGFDRLWIVAVTAVMLQTCFMTPPFGFALFYIKGVVPPEVKIGEIYKGVIPFILMVVIVVVLITVFPQIVYWLPNMVAS
ncbi:TRAP transporter large permease subunit [Butyricicoccus sp.]|uniref:TRAP transporter large permease n=1 Tax=Butyricicoccus sp. TaxID=2049021 RepID=UPI0037354586